MVVVGRTYATSAWQVALAHGWPRNSSSCIRGTHKTMRSRESLLPLQGLQGSVLF